MRLMGWPRATWFWYMPKRLITKPGVQNPHWLAWHCTIASCAGCSVPLAAAMSSTVHSAMPSMEWASRMQLLTALKRSERPPVAASGSASTTVQAPQSPSPQPSLVPVLPRSSRSISSRVRLGGTLPTDTTPPRFKKRMVFAATGGWIVKVMRLRVINLMTVSIQKPVSTQ